MYLFSTSAVAHYRQCVVGNIPLHAGHSGIDSGAGTTNVDAANLPHSPHKGWSTFFGWGITRNGFSMACRASAMCSSSGHVALAAVGEGLTPTVILPMSKSMRVAFLIFVPAVAASFSSRGAPGITCAAAPTHGGAVCVFVVSVVRCVCGNEEGGVAVP